MFFKTTKPYHKGGFRSTRRGCGGPTDRKRLRNTTVVLFFCHPRLFSSSTVKCLLLKHLIISRSSQRKELLCEDGVCAFFLGEQCPCVNAEMIIVRVGLIYLDMHRLATESLFSSFSLCLFFFIQKLETRTGH